MPHKFRTARAAWAALSVVLSSTVTAGGAGANEAVRINWRVPRDQVAELRDELRLDGTISPDNMTRDESRGLPLIYIFVGIVSLPSLISAIRTAVRDVICGGVVIEDKDDELAIRCEPSLGVGTVIVRSAGGVEVKRFEEVENPERLLDTITKLKGGR